MINTIAIYGFATVEEAIASGTALCKTANDAGIFLREDDPTRDRLTLKRVRRESKDWLKAVRKQIETMPVGDALKLLGTYDSVHRVAYGTPADPTFLNRYTMAAFESRIRGNKEVDPYVLYRQINAGIARRDPLYLGRPLQWSTTILDRWYKELSGSYSTFSGVHNSSGKGVDNPADTLYDRLQKASILMETDLWAYEGANQKAFKQQLFGEFSSLFYTVNDRHDLPFYNSCGQNTNDVPTTKTMAVLKSLYTLLISAHCHISKDIFSCCQKAIDYAINERTCIAFFHT